MLNPYHEGSGYYVANDNWELTNNSKEEAIKNLEWEKKNLNHFNNGRVVYVKITVEEVQWNIIIQSKTQLGTLCVRSQPSNKPAHISLCMATLDDIYVKLKCSRK